ncbi:unnamed protein product [Rhodiola kirilowii]
MISGCVLTHSLPFQPLLVGKTGSGRVHLPPPAKGRFLPRVSCQYSTCLSAGFPRFSGISSNFLSKKFVGISQPITGTPARRKLFATPKASPKDVPYSYRYPPMTKKPQWNWRTLACLRHELEGEREQFYSST